MLGNIIFDSSLIQVLPSVVHYLVWNLFKGIWIISMLGKVCLCLQADTCDHLLCYSVNFSPCFFNVIRSILMSNQSLKYFKIQDVTTWSGEKKTNSNLLDSLKYWSKYSFEYWSGSKWIGKLVLYVSLSAQFISQLDIPVGYQVNADQVLFSNEKRRKRFISIPTFISQSDEAGYSHESPYRQKLTINSSNTMWLRV